MRYTKGRIGRVFLVRFDNKDILLEEMKALARKERIKAAAFLFLGALRDGELVTGPKKAVIPPEPNRMRFKDGWEVLGIGTIFTGKEGPQLHVHVSMGKKNKTLTGCVRKNAKVFLVIEAVVLELEGIKAAKEIDPATGINLLRI